MNNPINRRSFLESTGKIGLASSAFPVSLTAKHHKKMRFTLGLSQYSLRALLRDGSLDALGLSTDSPSTSSEFKAIDLWEGGSAQG